jgi:hypothetical protein
MQTHHFWTVRTLVQTVHILSDQSELARMGVGKLCQRPVRCVAHEQSDCGGSCTPPTRAAGVHETLLPMRWFGDQLGPVTGMRLAKYGNARLCTDTCTGERHQMQELVHPLPHHVQFMHLLGI